MKDIKTNCFITAFSLVALVVFACAESRIDMAKQLYGYDQWVGTTKTNYAHTVTSFIPDFNGSGYSTNHPPIINDVTGGGYYYICTLKNNSLQDEIIDVTIDIRNDINTIHSFLMESFAYNAAIQPFPLGETMSVFVGDRCYLGYPTNSTRSISFVRNNVYVDLGVSGSTNSVLPIATWLDNWILNQSL